MVAIVLCVLIAPVSCVEHKYLFKDINNNEFVTWLADDATTTWQEQLEVWQAHEYYGPLLSGDDQRDLLRLGWIPGHMYHGAKLDDKVVDGAYKIYKEANVAYNNDEKAKFGVWSWLQKENKGMKQQGYGTQVQYASPLWGTMLYAADAGTVGPFGAHGDLKTPLSYPLGFKSKEDFVRFCRAANTRLRQQGFCMGGYRLVANDDEETKKAHPWKRVDCEDKDFHKLIVKGSSVQRTSFKAKKKDVYNPLAKRVLKNQGPKCTPFDGWSVVGDGKVTRLSDYDLVVVGEDFFKMLTPTTEPKYLGKVIDYPPSVPQTCTYGGEERYNCYYRSGAYHSGSTSPSTKWRSIWGVMKKAGVGPTLGQITDFLETGTGKILTKIPTHHKDNEIHDVHFGAVPSFRDILAGGDTNRMPEGTPNEGVPIYELMIQCPSNT